MCRMAKWFSLSYQEKRRSREDRIKLPFYTMQRINPWSIGH
ncbi:unnamed protein product, partial [Staurois parvus]